MVKTWKKKNPSEKLRFGKEYKQVLQRALLICVLHLFEPFNQTCVSTSIPWAQRRVRVSLCIVFLWDCCCMPTEREACQQPNSHVRSKLNFNVLPTATVKLFRLSFRLPVHSPQAVNTGARHSGGGVLLWRHRAPTVSDHWHETPK